MKKRIATHRQALLVWMLCLIAAAFGAVATIAVLDQFESGFKYAMIAFVWLVVATFVHTAISAPIYSAFLMPDGRVLFIWRYPFKRVSKVVEATAVPEPVIVSSRDSDGDRFFSAKITFSDGLEFIIAEPGVQTGQSKAKDEKKRRYCENACARFFDAVSQSREP